MKRLVLTWNSPHTFTIYGNGRRSLSGTLTIRKDRGTQRIRVRFPSGISLKMVRDAWEKQRRRWRNVANPPLHPSFFLAVRTIRLPKHKILWYVLHVNEKPFDACAVLPASKLVPHSWA